MKTNVKIAEFLLLRNNNKKPPSLLVVEAKQSTPHPETQPNFDIFIEEIRQKMTNALSLYLAVRLERHKDAKPELPDPFHNLELAKAAFHFVLVVKDHKKEWLTPLKDKLLKALYPMLKIWALPPEAVFVINEEKAKTYGLILKETNS